MVKNQHAIALSVGWDTPKMADIRVSIDRGGTFCDVIATDSQGQSPFIFKLLSEDPANYPDAPTEAIRRILERFEGRTIPVGEKLDASRIGLYLHSSMHCSLQLKWNSIVPYWHYRCYKCASHGKR